jgi:uncharacterized protein YbjT (DUF2867 family)
MKQKVFAIMGATGHIGRVIVEDLLKRGHTVWAIGRNVDKLHQLDIKGANLVITDFDDVQTLTQVFKQCYAVFSFIPPCYGQEHVYSYQDHISDAIVQAIQDSGCDRVINLSSMGADVPEKTGPILELRHHEEKLNTIENLKTLIHLRPSFFMENLNSHIPMILRDKVIRSPLDDTLLLPMVATRDIGWKAADFLDSTCDFNTMVFEFLGPKEYTMLDVTDVFAKYLDMPDLMYEHISYEEARNDMIQNGMSEEVANSLIEMYVALNSGSISCPKELKGTHHGTTTLEMYIQHMSRRLLSYA